MPEGGAAFLRGSRRAGVRAEGGSRDRADPAGKAEAKRVIL